MIRSYGRDEFVVENGEVNARRRFFLKNIHETMHDIEANGLVNYELDNKGTEDGCRSYPLHRGSGCGHGEVWSSDLVSTSKRPICFQGYVLIGHNIIDYDNRVMEKLAEFRPTARSSIPSSLVASCTRTVPSPAASGHSLKDWAAFVGDYKMQYDLGWEQYSEEMLEYCVQDVAANVSIFRAQERWVEDNWKLVNFEQQVAEICSDMASTGFGFDLNSAMALEYNYSSRKAEIEDELRSVFPTIVEERWSEKTGKRLKDKVTIFNPGSSKQWAERLADKYNWKPKLTDTGNPIVDEETLKSLDYPEAKLGLEYRDINKKMHGHGLDQALPRRSSPWSYQLAGSHWPRFTLTAQPRVRRTTSAEPCSVLA